MLSYWYTTGKHRHIVPFAILSSNVLRLFNVVVPYRVHSTVVPGERESHSKAIVYQAGAYQGKVNLLVYLVSGWI
jgi:hypothetical protein